MAEEITLEVEPQEPPKEPQGTDWKAEARKWEQRAKENKDASEKLKQLEEAQLSELEKAQKQAEEAKAEADRLRAEKVRDDAVKQAAKESGVDYELLTLMAGTSQEEIAANAELLKAKIAAVPKYPAIEDRGAQAKPALSASDILAIKNPTERLQRIAENADLF